MKAPNKIPKNIVNKLAQQKAELAKYKADGNPNLKNSIKSLKSEIRGLEAYINNYEQNKEILVKRKGELEVAQQKLKEDNQKFNNILICTIESLKREIAGWNYYLKNGKEKYFKNIEKSYWYQYECFGCGYKER